MRESDGSRRHAEITNLLKEANQQQAQQSKEDGARLERMMKGMMEALTGGQRMHQEIESLKQTTKKLERGVEEILNILSERGKDKGKRKKREKEEDEDDED